MSRDDELAETAAADTPALASSPATVGLTLGRYRVEGVLGAGGMGVVHAAFDPDLQRRVALKVLKTSGEIGDSARETLLREARAMARVKHPNVVTVYEVGSEGGRDYVAMELVEGESLAEWLRARRRPHEIVQAFVAAGRGLAAAHAAGLVHRDFKPHNVLRSRDGRVLVTDFGLARGIAGEPGADASSFGKETQTVVAGTPAYMAPEQWRGEKVGPAADQFAFAVALWEALAGARPFRGESNDELRQAVEAGPAGADASKIPRALREPLRRGLAADPTMRWPKIDDLLAGLDRRGARARLAITGSFAVVLAIAVAAVATRGSAAAAGGCAPPLFELLAGAHGRLELVRDALATASRYADACIGPASPRRAAVLACLDGVRVRASALGAAAEKVPAVSAEVVSMFAVAPSVCEREPAPVLRASGSPEVVAALVDSMDDRVDLATVLAFGRRPGMDACASTIVLAAATELSNRSEGRVIAPEALAAADRCGDDHLRAEALLVMAEAQEFELATSAEAEAALGRAVAAVDRVGDPSQRARLAIVRARAAGGVGGIDEATSQLADAIRLLDERNARRFQLRVAVRIKTWRFQRSDPEDLAAVHAVVAKWRPVAVALGDRRKVAIFDHADAEARFYAGDDRGVRDAMIAAWMPGGTAERHVVGIVRDPAGRPVAGALVVAGALIIGDSQSAWFPIEDAEGEQRTVRTGADGTFALEMVDPRAIVIAQRGELRSSAVQVADRVELVLLPTRRVDGHVSLGGIPSTRVRVWASCYPQDLDRHYGCMVVGPVAADGSFHLAGVPRSKVAVNANANIGAREVIDKSVWAPAGNDPVHVEIALREGERSITVVARSTLMSKLDAAYLLLAPGTPAIHDVADLLATEKEGGCTRVLATHARAIELLPRAQLHPDDLAARFEHLGEGTYTVCAVGLNGDLENPSFKTKLFAHAREMKLACKAFRSDAGTVVVETTPQARFE